MEILTFEQLEQEFEVLGIEEKIACVRAYVLSHLSTWKDKFEREWELDIDFDLIPQCLAPHGENAVKLEDLDALHYKIEFSASSDFDGWQQCGVTFDVYILYESYEYLRFICMERIEKTLTTERLDYYFLKFVLFLTLVNYACKCRCDMSGDQWDFFMGDIDIDEGIGKSIDKHYIRTINNPNSILDRKIKLNYFYRELYSARERAMKRF